MFCPKRVLQSFYAFSALSLAAALNPVGVAADPELGRAKFSIQLADLTKFSKRAQTIVEYQRSERIGELLRNGFNERQCKKETEFVTKILLRLIDGSDLRGIFQRPIKILPVAACSLPDGITVQTGGMIEINAFDLELLLTEDELAFIVAHELSHYILGHSWLAAEDLGRYVEPNDLLPGMPSVPERRLRLDRLASAMPHLQSQQKAREKEADETALQLLANAGYDSTAALDAYTQLFQAIGNGSIPDREDSTHYNYRFLVDNLRNRISEWRLPKLPRTPLAR